MFLNLPHAHEHGYQTHQHNYETSYEHLLSNLDLLTVNKQVDRETQMVLLRKNTIPLLRTLPLAFRMARAWIS